MSGLDVGYAKGLRFGGLPEGALRAKFAASEGAGAAAADYEAFVRDEIVDWGPDAPFLEGDQARRDPGAARGFLNLRYNGTRGSDGALPRHPDLFVGFLGDDPRGAGNDPRFERGREFVEARAGRLEPHFGRNDDQHLAESPWTGQALSHAKKAVHVRARESTRVFSGTRENRVRGGNIAADPAPGRRALRAELAAAGGGEALGRAAAGAEAGGLRGLAARPPAAPWRHAVASGGLGVARLGGARGAGRARLGPGASGGGRVPAAAADQAWGAGSVAPPARAAGLGAAMAAAARRAAGAAQAGDQALASGFAPAPAAGGGLRPGDDVARAWRRAGPDQAPAPPAAEAAAGLGAGLAPGADPGAARRGGLAEADAAAGRLANIGAIVSGLREGTAAGRRRAAGLARAEGARPPAPGGAGYAPGRGLAAAADAGRASRAGLADRPAGAAAALEAPGAGRGAAEGRDLAGAARKAVAPLAGSAAAQGLVVHAYGAAAPRAERKAAAARAGDEASAWRASREALPFGASRAPEWRSATQGQTSLGAAPERVFGASGEAAGSGAPVGPKTLRGGAWGAQAGLAETPEGPEA